MSRSDYMILDSLSYFLARYATFLRQRKIPSNKSNNFFGAELACDCSSSTFMAFILFLWVHFAASAELKPFSVSQMCSRMKTDSRRSAPHCCWLINQSSIKAWRWASTRHCAEQQSVSRSLWLLSELWSNSMWRLTVSGCLSWTWRHKLALLTLPDAPLCWK